MLHFAEDALRVARRLGDAAHLVGGYVTVGLSLLLPGKTRARHWRGIPSSGFRDIRSAAVGGFAIRPALHPGLQCQFFPMLISWMLGYPDQSLKELAIIKKC